MYLFSFLCLNLLYLVPNDYSDQQRNLIMLFDLCIREYIIPFIENLLSSDDLKTANIISYF
jgi:hypothetical protein